MRGIAQHPLAIPLRGIAGPQTDHDVPAPLRHVILLDLGQRSNQIPLNIIRQCFDGRDVDALNRLLRQSPIHRTPNEVVDYREESGEGLTRTGGGTEQHVFAIEDSRNRHFLGLGEIRKRVLEPVANRRTESIEEFLRRHEFLYILDFRHIVR